MANTTPNNISYPTNASTKKTFEGHIQDTADSVQTALNTKANLSGATFTGSVVGTNIGLGGVTSPSQKIDMSGRGKFRSDGSNSAGFWITDNAGTETAFFGASGTSSSDQIGVYHNGAWRLQVDSSGRVTVPYQPAFTAYASAYQIAANQTMPYNNAPLNRGSHFNTSTYRFTAPVAGVYMFNVYDIGQSSGTSRFSLSIRTEYLQKKSLHIS